MSNDLEECMAKLDDIMGSVHLHETQQCAVIAPNTWRYFIYPVASHCKVCILISGLPGIACETYKSSFVTLKNQHEVSSMKYHVKNDSYYEFELQIAQVFKLDDMLATDFAVRNIDALGCAS